MNIFVINSGSSSIKYQLIEMPAALLRCAGLVERIGLAQSEITHKVYRNGETFVTKKTVYLPSHTEGLAAVAALLIDTNPTIGVISHPNEIEVIGHRVVHGGEHFAETMEVNEWVKKGIKELFALAPLHNPANYLGIEVAEKTFPKAKQVVVFDTAFHQTMPAKAYRYAIPTNLYKQYGIRAYGFHGTSHKYVSEKAAEYLGKTNAKLITIHLGNGCSMAAIENGKCIDTSMGLGPVSGLVMGTRSGDIDPSVVFHLINQLGYSAADTADLLNKKSGMLGLCGFSDMRDVKAAIEQGNEDAALAYDLYAYRIKKQIGAYVAALNGLDALVFTAGVGENDAAIRALCTTHLDYLGIAIDTEKNAATTGNGIQAVQAASSKAAILVVPTNEELEIAKQCFELLG